MDSEGATRHDADEFAEGYRSLSPAAVVAAVLGMASPAVFAAPLLIVVPLVALVVSIVALRAIAANPEIYTGRSFALIGMTLATICLVASLTRDKVMSHLLAAQAEPTARAWISELAAGRVNESYLLTLSPTDRAQAITALSGDEPLPADHPMREAMQAYASSDVVERLSSERLSTGRLPAEDGGAGEAGPVKAGPVQIELVDSSNPLWVTSNTFRLTQRYAVSGAAGSSEAVELQLERTTPKGQNPVWRVADFALSPR